MFVHSLTNNQNDRPPPGPETRKRITEVLTALQPGATQDAPLPPLHFTSQYTFATDAQSKQQLFFDPKA